MRIKGMILLSFVVFLAQNGHSMNRTVGSQLITKRDTLSKKYSTTKLNVYYTNISDLKKKPAGTEHEVVGILNDALQNISDAFRIIDTKWISHSDMRESPEVQKMYCKSALYDLYWSLHEKFKDINSHDATQIRDELKKLGIIE